MRQRDRRNILDRLVDGAQGAASGGGGAFPVPGTGGHVRSRGNDGILKGGGVAAVPESGEHFQKLPVGRLHVPQAFGNGAGFGRQILMPVACLPRGRAEQWEFAQPVSDVHVAGHGLGRIPSRAEHLGNIEPEQVQLLLRFRGKILDGGGPHLPDGNPGHPPGHDEQGNDNAQQHSKFDGYEFHGTILPLSSWQARAAPAGSGRPKVLVIRYKIVYVFLREDKTKAPCSHTGWEQGAFGVAALRRAVPESPPFTRERKNVKDGRAPEGKGFHIMAIRNPSGRICDRLSDASADGAYAAGWPARSRRHRGLYA